MPFVVNPFTARVIDTRAATFRRLSDEINVRTLKRFRIREHAQREAARLRRQRLLRQESQTPPTPIHRDLLFRLPPIDVEEKIAATGASFKMVLAMILFLARLHENDCIPTMHIPSPRQRDVTVLLYKVSERTLIGSEAAQRMFRMCRRQGKRFMLFPLLLHFGGTAGHMNILIADDKTKTLERFEPHGQQTFHGGYQGHVQMQHMDKTVLKQFAEQLEYKYIAPIAYCPQEGLQAVQTAEQRGWVSGGFCAFWTLWYAHLRLEYPDVPRDQLIHDAIASLQNRGGQNPLTNFISRFSRFFTTYENRLATQEGIDELIQRFTGE